MDEGKRFRIMLNSCVCYYFSYGVIFVVFSRSFVGVGNFVCGSVDYPTVVSELWLGAHKGSRWGRRHHEGTNMLVQRGNARCTKGDTYVARTKKNSLN